MLSSEKVGELVDNPGAVGGMNFLMKDIVISKELPSQDQLITFLHECHHAISYITGQSQVTASDRFEIDAECYGGGFSDVFMELLKVNANT